MLNGITLKVEGIVQLQIKSMQRLGSEKRKINIIHDHQSQSQAHCHAHQEG